MEFSLIFQLSSKWVLFAHLSMDNLQNIEIIGRRLRAIENVSSIAEAKKAPR